jgi:ubiquinone biosynthesis protein Coq4
MSLSKYRSKEEAARAILALVAEAAERADALWGRVKWTDELEKALEALRRSLSAASGSL